MRTQRHVETDFPSSIRRREPVSQLTIPARESSITVLSPRLDWRGAGKLQQARWELTTMDGVAAMRMRFKCEILRNRKDGNELVASSLGDDGCEISIDFLRHWQLIVAND